MQTNIPICVFFKPPGTDTPKTRLVPAVGVDGAAKLAQAFFCDTWDLILSIPWACPVVASTSPVQFEDGREVWLQGQGDLSRRLERILRRGLRHSQAAFALGADSPGLPRGFLETARELIKTSDAVLGPSEDGGFYLVGVRRCPAGLFSGISWSQPTTFEQTQRQLQEFGLTVGILDPWFDVDVPADLTKLKSLIAAKTISVPNTTRALARLDLRCTVGGDC